MASSNIRVHKMNADFYKAFEEKFRGSRQLIKTRFGVYLPLAKVLQKIYPEGEAVDLGCGRGEWLELLNSIGISAKGVDLNEQMLAECRHLDLQVEGTNAIEFIKKASSESLILITGFHIAEHLAFEELQTLVQESLRVLKPGGVLILETPNPENIMVGSSGFYTDPTHNKPLPPQLLSFLPEYYGFERIKILRLNESNNPECRLKPSLLSVLEGVSPDYSVVSQKKADQDILTQISETFVPEYGIALTSLANAYDKKIEMKILESIKDASWIERIKRLCKIRKKSDDSSSIVTHRVIPTLFVDISMLAQYDNGTGIQRVVKNILKELIHNPPTGYLVKAVYAKPQKNSPYYYARKFTQSFLNLPSDSQEDPVIDPQAGDIFFGLDLHKQIASWQENFYRKLKNDGIHTFFVIHDLLPIILKRKFPRGSKKAHEKWMRVITQATGGICVSETVANDVRDWLKKNHPERLPFFRINHFHLGADIENAISSKGLHSNADEVLNKIKTVPSFLMVSTLEPRKGHQQTLAAFELLWEKNLNINLIFVGKKGWMVKLLTEKLEKHLQLNKRLFWLNHISDEYLKVIYLASTCLISASEGEGFGLPIIEAAKYHLPLILRDIPVFREVAGQWAYYFNGENPSDLAKKIELWLELYKEQKHPHSQSMPWLSWTESTEHLKKILLDTQTI